MDSGSENKITRKLLVALMEWLSRVQLSRPNDKVINVPVQYCSHQKFLEIMESSSARKMLPPEASIAPVEIQWILPRISVNLTGIAYDTQRHVNKINKIPTGLGETVFAPVPYNLEIEVSSVSKTIDDAFSIMESILPYFAPGMSLNVKLYDDMSESIAITLNTLSFDFPTEVDETTERLFTISYYFTMRANYYRQKKTSKIIYHPSGGTGLVDLTNVSTTDTLFEQFIANSQNPYPAQLSYDTKVTDLVQVTLKKRGVYDPTAAYGQYDEMTYMGNTYVGLVPNIPVGLYPSSTGWENYWTLLKVLNNMGVAVHIV